ncbi:hypothetical protein TGARI_368230 [Toxoplasma gondii ARI]|uniref:Uncharacterized protein n=1 Tax=Toxoplasma gondii ARI TaxID=1074872 RepID=A0A139Y9K6_TOXGO|nr:hypothetical protein TGARI_368230 [Toxoplasma gondii ARI]
MASQCLRRISHFMAHWLYHSPLSLLAEISHFCSTYAPVVSVTGRFPMVLVVNAPIAAAERCGEQGVFTTNVTIERVQKEKNFTACVRPNIQHHQYLLGCLSSKMLNQARRCGGTAESFSPSDSRQN